MTKLLAIIIDNNTNLGSDISNQIAEIGYESTVLSEINDFLQLEIKSPEIVLLCLENNTDIINIEIDNLVKKSYSPIICVINKGLREEKTSEVFEFSNGIIFWPSNNEIIKQNILFAKSNFISTNKLNELHLKIDELKRAKESAEKSDQAKSDFLASMSHEVRTPMNTVVGMMSLIDETDLTKEQKEYIEIVQNASQHLLTIINDILNLSKIEADKVQFEENELDLNKLIKEVVDSFKGNAEQKKLSLKYEVDNQIPDKLIGDPSHLKQIFYNIVGNAIKFTNKGSCSIKIKTADDPSYGAINEDELRVMFEVKDTGIGIHNDKIDTIFNSFSQAHSDTKRNYEGTGLGLAISQKLTEKMGGNIWVESTEGKGSTFYFTILFKIKSEPKTEELPQNTQKIDSQVSDNNSLNILIAEDNELNQKLISRILKSKGHRTTIGENGIEAIEALRNDTFDLIFMDIQMPDMDGIEATIQIRKDNSGKFDPNITIVAVTAYAFDEDKQRCFDVGMNDFIPKPISNEKLNSVLDEILKKKKKNII